MNISNRFFLLMFAFFLFAGGCEDDPPIQDPKDQPKLEYTVVDEVYSPGLENNLLGDSPDRAVKVYLPPDYYEDSLKNYPVIYLLHGYYADHDTWYTGMTPSRDFAYIGMDLKQIMDDLIKEGTVQSMIIVTPSSYNSFKGSWYANSSVTGNWEDFITEDVVSYTDNNYRTIASPGGRGVAGHSMGGYGAMKLAMKHPDLFSAVYCHSASYLVLEEMLEIRKDTMLKAMEVEKWDKSLSLYTKVMLSNLSAFSPNPDSEPFYGDFPLTIEGELIDTTWQKWLEHDPFTMISTYTDKLLQLRAIQFDVGTQEDNVSVSAKFSGKLTSHGIDHVFETYEGKHANRTVERLELKVLPFFSENLDHSK